MADAVGPAVGSRQREQLRDGLPGLGRRYAYLDTAAPESYQVAYVVHPNATGSMMTGHGEWDDLDWEKPVAHPTIFEVFRRATGAGDLEAWAFVYASILAKVGESRSPRFAANVVVPPTIPNATAERMDHQLRQAAAGLEFLGLEASIGAAASVWDKLRITTRQEG